MVDVYDFIIYIDDNWYLTDVYGWYMLIWYIELDSKFSPTNINKGGHRIVVIILSSALRSWFVSAPVRWVEHLDPSVPWNIQWNIHENSIWRSPVTLLLFNIAMEAMAHRNRWFSQRHQPPFILGIFHGYVSHNHMVSELQEWKGHLGWISHSGWGWMLCSRSSLLGSQGTASL